MKLKVILLFTLVIVAINGKFEFVLIFIPEGCTVNNIINLNTLDILNSKSYMSSKLSFLRSVSMITLRGEARSLLWIDWTIWKRPNILAGQPVLFVNGINQTNHSNKLRMAIYITSEVGRVFNLRWNSIKE